MGEAGIGVASATPMPASICDKASQVVFKTSTDLGSQRVTRMSPASSSSFLKIPFALYFKLLLKGRRLRISPVQQRFCIFPIYTNHLKRIEFKCILEDLKLLSNRKLDKHEWNRLRIVLKTAVAFRQHIVIQKLYALDQTSYSIHTGISLVLT